MTNDHTTIPSARLETYEMPQLDLGLPDADEPLECGLETPEICESCE